MAFLPTVFVEQTDSQSLLFALLYIGERFVGKHIVGTIFLFISFYQTANTKCSPFLRVAPGWRTNKRNREGVK
jgi:hypothetical protein